MLKIIQTLAFILFLFFQNISSANAEDLPDLSRPNDWHFSLAPYVWMTGTNGFYSIRDQKANFSIPFTNWHNIDFGGSFDFEANKEKWSLLLNPSYFKVTQIEDINNTKAKATLGLTAIDAGVYYQLFPINDLKKHDLTYSFELLGAFRIIGAHSVIKFLTGTPSSLSDTTNVIAPILGGRFKYNLSKKTQVWIESDLGGFKIDRVASTWSATTGINLSLSKLWGISLAYKALSVHYYKKAYHLNIIAHGPMIGLNYTL
jgi:hypothetical protein